MYFISESIILYTVTDATITEIKNGKRTSLFTTARDWDWLRQKNLQLRSKYGGKNCIKSVQLWNKRIVHDSEVSVLRNCSTHIIIKVNTYIKLSVKTGEIIWWVTGMMVFATKNNNLNAEEVCVRIGYAEKKTFESILSSVKSYSH